MDVRPAPLAGYPATGASGCAAPTSPRRRQRSGTAVPLGRRESVATSVWSGSATESRVPRPGSLATATRPSCTRTRSETSASPTPDPSAVRARASGLRQKRSKMRSSCSGLDADARVRHLDDGLAVAHGERHLDLPAGVGVPQGVGEEVVDDLGEPLGIADHARGRDVVRQLDRQRAAAVGVAGDAGEDDGVEVDRALADEQPRPLRLGEAVDVVDEAADAVRVALDLGERDVRVGDEAVAQRLDAR